LTIKIITVTDMETQKSEAAPQPSPVVPQRRGYLGQCHCGFIKYIAWLTLPAEVPYKSGYPCGQMFRKCNCTMCHKTGFLHIRLANPPKDFALLSPLDPVKELSSYGRSGMANWCFCKTCGVRCFLIEGEGEVNEVDLASPGDVDLERAKIEGDGTKVKVFQPNKDWKEEGNACLRINALTLDAKQEGLDLREWGEKKWIQYVNWLEEIQGYDYERPYVSGTY
jgi:hypothetical protein